MTDTPRCASCHEPLSEVEDTLGATRCGRCQMAHDRAAEQLGLGLKPQG